MLTIAFYTRKQKVTLYRVCCKKRVGRSLAFNLLMTITLRGAGRQLGFGERYHVGALQARR